MSIDTSTSDLSEYRFETQTTSGLTSVLQLIDHTHDEMFIINHSTAGRSIALNFNEEYLKEELMRLIKNIIQKITSEDIVFDNINKEKLINSLEKNLNKIPIEKIPFDQFELEDRIKKILALELMSGLLDDLTPEQLEAFEKSLNRS